MATALYRRYRPETFAEMIGQTQVTEPIMTALRNGRIGHAYLFSGPRGCGKTTAARVLARCLNCVDGPTDTPCGVCQSCVELSRDGGGSLDVIEIDAASHGGVDDARDLRERAIFAPIRDRFKIFIIDEAHMVSKEGFNALLKIVEEPPPHVKFVFATTEPEKVIGTIRSRTHHYPFRLIPPAPLLNYIAELCESEGVTVDNGVLPFVIRAGGGSARDTLSILDQLIAGSEDSRVDYERAVALLGFTHDDLLDEVVDALANNDAAAGVQTVDRVIQTGQDPRRFVEDLLERLRDLIVVQATDVAGAAAVLRGVPEEQLRRMFDQASRFAPGLLSTIADIVSEALDRMTGATAPRLHLELMVARAFVAIQKNSQSQQSHPAGPTAPAAEPATQPTTATATDTPTPTAQPATSAPAASQPGAPQSGAPQQGQPEPVAPQPSVQQPDAAEATAPEDAVAQPAAPESVVPQPAASSPGVPLNAAQAAMQARAFLARESVGESVSSGGAPAQYVTPEDEKATEQSSSQPAEPHDEAPAAGDSAQLSDQSGETSQSFTTETVAEAWPQLLIALQQKNEAAWRATRPLEVLEVAENRLALRFDDAAVLEQFKHNGAAQLRDLIAERFGVTVQYFPRVQAAASQATPQTSPETASATPTEAPNNAPQPPQNGVSTPNEPDKSEAPVDTTLDREPPLDEVHEALPPDDSEAAPVAATAEETPASAAKPETEPQPEPEPAPEPQPRPEVQTQPEFIRYGEAVVREVLAAKFIEEQPLPPERG